jgi:hypothetical protein
VNHENQSHTAMELQLNDRHEEDLDNVSEHHEDPDEVQDDSVPIIQ